MKKKKELDPQKIRERLLTIAILISYVTFTTMGIIMQKYHPYIGKYSDIIIYPLSCFFIVFIYLFSITYEKRFEYKLDEQTLRIVELYGEGLSFQKIVEELEGVNHLEDVKRSIKKFCKLRR